MNPVIIHADGTDCRHEGEPRGTAADGAPACPAGQRVTHIRFNGRTLSIAEAYEAFQAISAAFTQMLTPVLAGLGAAISEFGRRLSDANPVFRGSSAAGTLTQDADGPP